MLHHRRILAGVVTAVALAMAVPAFAQSSAFEPAPGQEETAGAAPYITIFHANGLMTSVPLDKKMASDAMAHAKPLSGAIMVLVSNGKAYAVPDTKMASGEMMSQYLSFRFRSPDRSR